MDPLLIDVPESITTPRLLLRCPRRGDGPALLAAQSETLAELQPWMPWAQEPPTAEYCEAYCRRMHARFILREDLVWLVFERDAGGEAGGMLASVGLHRMDWSVPRFEIGYWRRTGSGGRGLVAEAVQALTRLCFDQLGAQRVEIRMDADNAASERVALRAGYTFEALLRDDSRTPQGVPRGTRVYARVRGVEEAKPSAES
jgi:RimJ/RimL family protein N-acetyltransferase